MKKNMFLNVPAQFCLFICLLIFVFSFFISPKIFCLMMSFFKWKHLSCCFYRSCSVPSVNALPPFCYFSNFRVSSWGQRLQNWNFSQYSRCGCTVTVFNVSFCILFNSNSLNTVAFWVLLSCRCVKKGKLQVVFYISLGDVSQGPSDLHGCYRT